MRFWFLPLLLTGCGPAVEVSTDPWTLCVPSASIDPRAQTPRVAVLFAEPTGDVLVGSQPVEGYTPAWSDACVARSTYELGRGTRLAFRQVPADGGEPRVLWSTLLQFPEPTPVFRLELPDDQIYVDHYHLSLLRAAIP